MRLNFEKDRLVIALDDEWLAEIEEWLAEHKATPDECNDYDCLQDTLEGFFANSESRMWMPESDLHEHLSALTGGALFTDWHKEDDHGNIIEVGNVYWDEPYQVRNLVATLLEKGEVVIGKAVIGS